MTPADPVDRLTVEKLAEILQEPNVLLLRQVLRMLGPDRTTAVLTATLQCEAAGGMRTNDGTRRRTPGGTFSPAVLTWEEARTLIQTLAPEPPGEARTMKLTLIGRPGRVETRGQAVLFRMQGKAPGALPRGLPPVPATAPLTWNVMVALRQWNRVQESLATHQDDQLIIEGYPLMQGNQPVLLAQSCVSMLQQRAQKEAQRQPTEPTT